MNSRLDRIAPGVPAKLSLALDSLMVFLALFLACPVWREPADVGFFSIGLVGATTWFLAAAVIRLYSPCTPRSILDELVLVGVAVLGVTVCLVITSRVVPHSCVEDLAPVELALTLYGLRLLNSIVFIKPLLSRLKRAEEQVLVVGTTDLGRATARSLTTSEENPRCVAGFVRFPTEPRRDAVDGVAVLGEVGDLSKILCEHVADEVYIAGRYLTHGVEIQRAVAACEEVGVPFALPLQQLQFERATLRSSSPARDGYLHYLSTRCRPFQYALKRLVDIVAASLALALLSPILVLVAIAIRLTSQGPVLFRQVRVGLHGTRFNVLKFRSMVSNAEALKEELESRNEQTGPVFKMANDPRVTAVGRFIRKYSIDELPQLINVLRGDMTLVGPRPALPSEVAQYKAWQRRRLSVRPGLTCYWQVSGRNGIRFEQWMRLDLRYVDNWSLSLDLKLILQTFPVVLRGTGAS